MNALPRSWAACSVLLLSLGLAAAGCGDDKKADVADAGDLDAGKQKQVLGGKLGAAVAAAESAQAAAASAKAKDGPPESGVFGPGEADKALPPGTPSKVDVLGEGAEPRVQLAFTPTGDEQRSTLVLSIRSQGGMMNLEYHLALKVDKPKEEKKSEAPAGKAVRVLARVTSVEPAADVRSQVPKDIAEQIAKIKGSEIRYQLLDGSISDVKYTLAKDADATHDATLRSLGEALSLATIPLPNKPVGKGGFWMVADHAVPFSVDVIRYRVYRVESIDKDRAVLAVETRQYATKSDLDLGAQAKGQKLTLDRFDSQGKGKVEWVATSFLPGQGDTSVRIQAFLGVAGGQPNQKAMLQTEMAVKVVPNEAAKPDKKK